MLAAGAPGPVRDPRLPRQHWHSAPHPPAGRGPGDVAERDARSEAAIKPMAGASGQRADRRTRS
jgi:hypothetical protein